MSSEDLHIKYRPTDLDEVVGQDEVVASLQALLKKGSPPSTYLFVGPSGVGKTTIARILASKFGCSPQNRIEVDAATFNGVDNIRILTDGLKYKGFGASPAKVVILDEAHALTKQAWQALLKVIEDTPQDAYFMFCTTEVEKVPKTIQTRCHSYILKAVPRDDVFDLVRFVADQEPISVSDKVIERIISESHGSVRQALVFLSMVSGASSDSSAMALIRAVDEGAPETIDFCRLLIKGGTWKKMTTLLDKLPDKSPEGIRILVVKYTASCLLGTSNDQEVCRLLSILREFSEPCNPSEGLAPILLAIGGCIYGEEAG